MTIINPTLDTSKLDMKTLFDLLLISTFDRKISRSTYNSNVVIDDDLTSDNLREDLIDLLLGPSTQGYFFDYDESIKEIQGVSLSDGTQIYWRGEDSNQDIMISLMDGTVIVERRNGILDSAFEVIFNHGESSSKYLPYSVGEST